MEIIIHRGTHQIGGIATEIKTEKTSVIIDLGSELGLGEDFVPEELHIPGVTDKDDNYRKPDAVLFTHQHGDHIGQLYQLRDDVPIYMGAMTRDLELVNEYKYRDCQEVYKRIENAKTFKAPKKITVGDIRITPIAVDHSACDAYMFLLEADGKRILYTGDFRLHGFRGKGVISALKTYVKKVNAVITEGTTFSREKYQQISEITIKNEIKKYLRRYKYVFVLCSSMNLDRIAGCAAATPYYKFFLCDKHQRKVNEVLKKYYGPLSEFYNFKNDLLYLDSYESLYKKNGFLMLVRANERFKRIMARYPKDKSIVLYGLWKGYLEDKNSSYGEVLDGYNWEYLHTSGHACLEDVKEVLDLVNPDVIIPMHTELPEALVLYYPDKIITLQDGEVYRM